MIYVTSDLHGYPLDAFRNLLSSAGFDDDDRLYVLGDVIDRNGDGGVAALRWFMEQPNVELLMGNHEDMLLSCSFLFEEDADENIDRLSLEQLQLLLNWMRNGAAPTIDSLRELQRENPEALDALLSYLETAPLYVRVNAGGREFLLVHSGLENFSPDRDLNDYAPDELIWHRPAPGETYFQDVMTIFGHTPTKYLPGGDGKIFRTETWMDIDTGAAGGGAPMLLRLDDLKEFYAPESE